MSSQAENHGSVYTYTAADLNAVAAFRPTAMRRRLPVGHFHVLPYGDLIIAPHTGVSKAFILNRTGSVVREYNCTGCHGAATFIQSAVSPPTSSQPALPAERYIIGGCRAVVLAVHVRCTSTYVLCTTISCRNLLLNR